MRNLFCRLKFQIRKIDVNNPTAIRTQTFLYQNLRNKCFPHAHFFIFFRLKLSFRYDLRRLFKPYFIFKLIYIMTSCL